MFYSIIQLHINQYLNIDYYFKNKKLKDKLMFYQIKYFYRLRYNEL